MVTNTRGVTGFVGPAGHPQPLTNDEIKRMGLERIEATDLEMAVGDNVKIISGALESFIGTVEEIDIETQKIKVSVSLFGRSTPVDLDLNQVVKL